MFLILNFAFKILFSVSEPEQLCCSHMQSRFLKNGAFFFPQRNNILQAVIEGSCNLSW